jgi:hypothetical protein
MSLSSSPATLYSYLLITAALCRENNTASATIAVSQVLELSFFFLEKEFILFEKCSSSFENMMFFNALH